MIIDRPERHARIIAPVLVGLAAALVACGGGRAAEQVVYSPAELRSAVADKVDGERDAEGDAAPTEVPYEVSEALVERAREVVEGVRSDHDRAHRLLRAITDDDVFGLEWEPVSTTSAERTVERGYGNCLSLTSLYVGLARRVGLTAYYIDASDRINELRREKQVIVDSGHIAAVVRTERGYSMVDFDGEISDYRTFRVVADIEALAHFYNNKGYELIHRTAAAGEEVPWEKVAELFEMATRIRPYFARARNNLGVVYSKLGRLELAGAQYRAAVAADPDFAAPLHNLGNLKLRQEKYDEALEVYRRAVGLQSDNPFLHYHRGVAYYQSRRLEKAERAFRRAISLKHDYVEPRNLLVQVYTRLGERERAREVLEALKALHRSSEAP